MGLRNRAWALAAAPLAMLLVLCALPAIAAQAPAAAPIASAPDALEPAKAAIRIKDYGSAARLLTEQAARGNADAQYLLGTMVLADLVPQSSRAQAQQLFESAAGKGNARAAYALAAMHATGEPRDPAGAKAWLERAAKLGDPVARDMLQRGVLPLEVRPQDSLLDEASRRVELWRAARRGDLVTLEVLATPERVNAGDDFGRTALHYAAEAGSTEAISLLISRGAKIDATDQYGVTPLMLACAVDPPDACARLLQARASVAAADRGGNTALAYALRHGRSQQAKDLRGAGSAPVAASVVTSAAGPMDHLPRAVSDTYAGWPDVVVAASRKDPAKLRGLLGRGGDPNATAPGGASALAVAVASDSPAAASVLLAAGADVSRPDGRGLTPLELAVRLGHDAVVEALLQHGANPNAHAAREEPLIVDAVESGDARMVRDLLAAGADSGARGGQGATPLMISAARDRADIVGLLLDAKAAPSVVDSSGRSALWFAACADAAAAAPY